MLEIRVQENGQVDLIGRFDASQVDKAKEAFGAITESTVINFQDLDYISSAGLGVLLATQKRLSESGEALKLTNMSKHIRDVFRYAGFDTIFDIA